MCKKFAGYKSKSHYTSFCFEDVPHVHSQPWSFTSRVGALKVNYYREVNIHCLQNVMLPKCHRCV